MRDMYYNKGFHESAQTLAHLFRVTPMTINAVLNHRGAYDGKHVKNEEKTTILWDSVDWSKQNVIIASEFGCSSEAVRLKRKKLGKPPSPRHHKITTPKQSKYDFSNVDWSLRDVEIAKILGCATYLPGKKRKELGIPDSPYKYKYREPRYDWSSVDWSLTDYRIAKNLGCTARSVALRRIQFFPADRM